MKIQQNTLSFLVSSEDEIIRKKEGEKRKKENLSNLHNFYF